MPRRTYPGQRLIRILMRTGHIAAAALLIGGAVRGETPTDAVVALLVTGSAVTLDALYRDGGDWFRYLGSWVVLAKLGLLVVGLSWPGLLESTCWAALVLGGLISHAPGRIRQAALWGPPGPCAVRLAPPLDRPKAMPDATGERAI